MAIYYFILFGVETFGFLPVIVAETRCQWWWVKDHKFRKCLCENWRI